jgi:hypothetical protein
MERLSGLDASFLYVGSPRVPLRVWPVVAAGADGDEVAINALLNRLPDLRLDPTAPEPGSVGWRSAHLRRCQLIA